MPPDTLVSLFEPMPSATGTAHYADQFSQVQKSLPGQNSEWLAQQRKLDLARFSKMGFPSQQDEGWRHTPLRPITSKTFSVTAASVATQTALAVALESSRIANLDSYQIVFVDGQYDSQLSMNVPKVGVMIEPMSAVLAHQPQSIKNLLGSVIGSVAGDNKHGFTSLNNAFYKDGIVIRLDANTQFDKAIELIFLSQSEMLISQPRNLIVAGANSKAQIIERYVSASDAHTFINSTTEVVLEHGAELDYYVIQTQSRYAYQVCGIWAQQAAKSRFSCRTITLGGALVRNDLRSKLDGVNAHCDMLGIFSLTGKQHVDNHTTVLHQAENCSSTELYKGVLNQRSRGVFHGRIKVAPGAQKTDAQQTNNTLLLSRDAEIDTQPQLEIYADDVQCSHGATIGQIDESALFYLRTRGIDTAQARLLLTYAFVYDVLNRIDIVPLKDFLFDALATELAHKKH